MAPRTVTAADDLQQALPPGPDEAAGFLQARRQMRAERERSVDLDARLAGLAAERKRLLDDRQASHRRCMQWAAFVDGSAGQPALPEMEGGPGEAAE